MKRVVNTGTLIAPSPGAEIRRGVRLFYLLLLFVVTISCNSSKKIFLKCDELIAKENAIRALKDKYGRRHVNQYSPYIITSINDTVWQVRGTLYSDVGGVPVAEVSKVDCRVVKIIHYK